MIIVLKPADFFIKRDNYRKSNLEELMVYYVVTNVEGKLGYELRMSETYHIFKTVINEANIKELLISLKHLRLDEEADMITMFQLLDVELRNKSLSVVGFE